MKTRHELQDEWEEIKELFRRASRPTAGSSAEAAKTQAVIACARAYSFFQQQQVLVLFAFDATYCPKTLYGGHCRNCKAQVRQGDKAWSIATHRGGGVLCKRCGDQLAGQLDLSIF